MVQDVNQRLLCWSGNREVYPSQRLTLVEASYVSWLNIPLCCHLRFPCSAAHRTITLAVWYTWTGTIMLAVWYTSIIRRCFNQNGFYPSQRSFICEGLELLCIVQQHTSHLLTVTRRDSKLGFQIFKNVSLNYSQVQRKGDLNSENLAFYRIDKNWKL